MRIRKFIFYAILAGILAGAIFFRSNLENIFLHSSQKLAELATDSIDTLTQSIEKEVSAPPPLRSQREERGADLTKTGVLKFANAERQKVGLPRLTENEKLAKAALLKAEDIFAKQYFAHESPEGKGPQDLAEAVGYDYLAIGENLALGNFLGDQNLINAWMASTGHRENILGKKFTQIGIAVLKGTYEGKTTWIAVQELGTPSSECPSVDAEKLAQIEKNKREIETLAAKLKNQKDAVKKTDSENEYLELVRDYNGAAERHNGLVAKTRESIDNYNRQVKTRNDCLENFTSE